MSGHPDVAPEDTHTDWNVFATWPNRKLVQKPDEIKAADAPPLGMYATTARDVHG